MFSRGLCLDVLIWTVSLMNILFQAENPISFLWSWSFWMGQNKISFPAAETEEIHQVWGRGPGCQQPWRGSSLWPHGRTDERSRWGSLANFKTLLINFPLWLDCQISSSYTIITKTWSLDLGWIILLVVFSTKQLRKILVNLFLSSGLLVSVGGWEEIGGYKSQP